MPVKKKTTKAGEKMKDLRARKNPKGGGATKSFGVTKVGPGTLEATSTRSH